MDEAGMTESISVGSLPKFFFSLLGQLASTSVFFGEFSKHSLFYSKDEYSRIGSMAVGKVSSRAQASIIRSISRMAPSSSNISVYDFISQILDMLYLDLIAVPKPTLTDGKYLNQFLMIPKLAFFEPPMCNIVTSNQISEWSKTVDYTQEPTRLIYNLTRDGNSRIYLAYPEELMNSGKTGLNMNPVFLPEEKWKLFNPLVTSADILRYGSLTQEEGSNLSEWAASYTEMKYFIQHSRTLSVTSVFNPDVIPGLPAYVLSTRGLYKGMVDSVEHTFSYSTSSYSRINLTHVTPINTEYELAHHHPVLEDINKYYMGNGKAEDLYNDTFGVQSSTQFLREMGIPITSPTHNQVGYTLYQNIQKWSQSQKLQVSELLPSFVNRSGVSKEEYLNWFGSQKSFNWDYGEWNWNRSELDPVIDLINEMLRGVYSLAYDQAVTEKCYNIVSKLSGMSNIL
jgi:hypothetical protein